MLIWHCKNNCLRSFLHPALAVQKLDVEQLNIVSYSYLIFFHLLQAFLRRLEKVKPTKELSRDHLLREHFKKEKLSSNSRSKRPPSSALRSKRSSSLSDLSQIDRDSFISSQGSVSSLQKAGTARRPISAKVHSKTRKRVDTQPVWEAGW